MENLVSAGEIYVAACIIWRAAEFDRNPPRAGLESQLSLFVKEMMNKRRRPMERAAFRRRSRHQLIYSFSIKYFLSVADEQMKTLSGNEKE